MSIYYKTRIKQTAFLIGLSLITFAALILLLSTVLFALGGTMQAWILPVAIGAILFLLFNLSKKASSNSISAMMSIVMFLAVLSLSTLLVGSFYDKSWDGQAYHQEAVIQLASGWNPYYDQLDSSSVAHEKWITHYAKGPWILAASIYLFTDSIESAKVFDVLFIIASFLLLLSALLAADRFSCAAAAAVSAIAALNPVSVYQSLNFYIDGQLAGLLLSLLAACIHFARKPDKCNSVLICCLLLLIVNVKFTGIPFAVVALMGFTIYLGLYRGLKLYFSRLACFFSVLLIGIGAVGYNPYITNAVNNGHPFYPLMGKDAVDIMGPAKPNNLKKMNRYEALFVSLFSESVNNIDGTHLKIPFTIGKTELYTFYGNDIRVSGLGPLFSALLMMGGIGFIVFYKFFPPPRLSWGVTLVTLIVSVLIHPESWWARYVPQLWLVPICISAVCLMSTRRFVKVYGMGLVFLGAVNIYLVTEKYIEINTITTSRLEGKFAVLKKENSEISICFGAFDSTRIRLQEAHVPYIKVSGRDLPCAEPELLPGGEQQVSYCTVPHAL